MNILKISNIFNLLVQNSDFFQSYHFGYHSDINASIPNNFDNAGEAGKMFPHVTWVAPVEGKIKMRGNGGEDQVDVMLLFYDLQDYRNDGEPRTIEHTLAWQWSILKARAMEFVHGLNLSREVRVLDSEIRWFTDSNAHIDRLICVGLEFKLTYPYGCCDYEAQAPPLSAQYLQPSGEIDLEARNVG